MNAGHRMALALAFAAGTLTAHAGSRVEDLEKLGENAGVFSVHLRRSSPPPRPPLSAPVGKPSRVPTQAPKPVPRAQPGGPTPEEIRERQAAKERRAAQRRREQEERKRQERMAALEREGTAKPSPSPAPAVVAEMPGALGSPAAAPASPSPAPVLSPEERTRRLGLLARHVAEVAVDEAP